MMVYGWNIDGRHRAIVKVRSRAAARRAVTELGFLVSDHHLKNYGSETGNEVELAAAEQAGEGVVLVASNQGHRRDYRPLLPRSEERDVRLPAA